MNRVPVYSPFGEVSVAAPASDLSRPRSAEGSEHREQDLSALLTGSPRDAAREEEIRRWRRLREAMVAIGEAMEDQSTAALAAHLASALHATGLSLWALTEDGERLTCVGAVGERDAHERVLYMGRGERQPARPAQGASWRSEPVFLCSARELSAACPELSVRSGAGSQSLASIPFGPGAAVKGAIVFSFADDRVADPLERDLLHVVACQAAQALLRSRSLVAERALRAQAEAAANRLSLSSRASRAFAADSPQLERLVSAMAHQLVVDYADSSCVALLSLGALEIVAADHRDRDAKARLGASHELAALCSGPMRRAVDTGEPLVLTELAPELRGSLASGGREVHSLAVVPLWSDGRVVGALGAVRYDPARAFSLDDQRLLEELSDRASVALAAGRLQRANEQARVRAEILYELAAGVIQANTVDAVFDTALDGIERALGATRCSILVFDADGVMRFKAWRGLSESYRQAVEGHSPWARGCENPQPIVVPNVLADEELQAFSALFQSEGIGALGFIPLVSEGRLIGKFMVYYPEPRQLSAAELEMGRAIANHVAAAIGRFTALRELEQTVRFNEIFTGMLGHDLRNPLGAIMAAAQIALRRSDGGPLDKPLARIVKSGERMATMIDQLLDFTRVRVGAGIPLDPRPADLGALVRQAVDELCDTHPEWTFSFSVEGGDLSGVWDVDRILQMFSNLVANAVQHGSSPEGVRVFFDGSQPESVSVCIHNMGAVPAELLPRLFEPMAGGDRRRSNSRGLGLGLYISREIARSHGGEVSVATSPDAGTTFTVRLPRLTGPASTGGAACS